MTSNYDALKTQRKTGKEQFHISSHPTRFTLLGFWQWLASDLVDNALRGALAEYIVACDLGIADSTRPGWNAYDLITDDGIKVEVKSAAYLQSWKQSAPSKICFDIRPTFGWDAITNTSGAERKRQADVYVFCLLAHADKATLDPLNLSQWEFYILLTRVLDEKLPTQRTISLATLLKLEPVKVEFGMIGKAIASILDERNL
jgi:hypothetical protein